MSEAFFKDRYFATYAAPAEPLGEIEDDRPVGAPRAHLPLLAGLPDGVKEGFELMREMLSLLPSDRPSAEACPFFPRPFASSHSTPLHRNPRPPAGATPSLLA